MNKRTEFINAKEFRRIIWYLNRNYPPLEGFGYHTKMMHTKRILKSEDGLVTGSYVSAFDGDTFHRIIIHLSVRKEGENEIIAGETNIQKDIFSLEEFIEIESKAEQLTQFTKLLNLWKH